MTEVTQRRLDLVCFSDLDEEHVHAEDHAEAHECSQAAEQEEEGWEASV